MDANLKVGRDRRIGAKDISSLCHVNSTSQERMASSTSTQIRGVSGVIGGRRRRNSRPEVGGDYRSGAAGQVQGGGSGAGSRPTF